MHHGWSGQLNSTRGYKTDHYTYIETHVIKVFVTLYWKSYSTHLSAYCSRESKHILCTLFSEMKWPLPNFMFIWSHSEINISNQYKENDYIFFHSTSFVHLEFQTPFSVMNTGPKIELHLSHFGFNSVLVPSGSFRAPGKGVGVGSAKHNIIWDFWNLSSPYFLKYTRPPGRVGPGVGKGVGLGVGWGVGVPLSVGANRHTKHTIFTRGEEQSNSTQHTTREDTSQRAVGRGGSRISKMTCFPLRGVGGGGGSPNI